MKRYFYLADQSWVLPAWPVALLLIS